LASSKRKYRLGYTFEEYRNKVESGEWQLHEFKNGFLITEVVKFADDKVLMVHLVGGEQFDAWKEEAQERLIKFGREQGCLALEAACRFGDSIRSVSMGSVSGKACISSDILGDITISLL